jgi:molecular chaperone GrpE
MANEEHNQENGTQAMESIHEAQAAEAEPAGENGPAGEPDWRAEADRLKDAYYRAQAEMENMKKRLEREKVEHIKFANESLIRGLLPVLDNLERALGHAPSGGDDVASFVQGIRMIQDGLWGVLDRFGVKKVSAVGELFDPHRHEAMMQRDDAEAAPNTVLDEVQKGYVLNDRLLRPAMVIIARRP